MTDAAAAALERGLEQPHQIFGLFQDLHVGVADDAEAPTALHRVAGKQLADEQAGDGLDRDQPHRPPAAACGRRTKRSIRFGMRISAFIALPSLARASCKRDRKSEIGNEREGMRRIDRQRRQQRKDVGEKIVFEPGLLGLGDIARRRPARCRPRPSAARNSRHCAC